MTCLLRLSRTAQYGSKNDGSVNIQPAEELCNVWEDSFAILRIIVQCWWLCNGSRVARLTFDLMSRCASHWSWCLDTCILIDTSSAPVAFRCRIWIHQTQRSLKVCGQPCCTASHRWRLSVLPSLALLHTWAPQILWTAGTDTQCLLCHWLHQNSSMGWLWNFGAPTVSSWGAHALASVFHCLGDSWRNGLCCVSYAQADDLCVWPILLVCPSPSCNLNKAAAISLEGPGYYWQQSLRLLCEAWLANACICFHPAFYSSQILFASQNATSWHSWMVKFHGLRLNSCACRLHGNHKRPEKPHLREKISCL